MKKYNIGIEVALKVIAGKWKPLILCYVGTGVNRNGQLLKAIPNISQKVLTQQLNQLIEDNILEKQVFPEIPLHVEYHYTQYGESLRGILLNLCHWGEQHAKMEDQENNVQIELTHHFSTDGKRLIKK